MKIAVVGSGISGLVSAYYLSGNAEVHVFEANHYIGGHTHTHDVQVPSGHYNVDTGFIVFNDRTYPRFIRLMNELGVASQPSKMSFSVKAEAAGLEYNGTDMNGLFAQRSNLLNPSFYRMILDILRFNREAPLILENSKINPEMTLGEYLAANNYSSNFMDHYVIPMGAAIWSAGVEQMREFPVVYFVRFFKNHGMLSVNDRPTWRTIKNGSSSYLPALSAPFKNNIHLNTPVRSVRRAETDVIVTVEKNGTQEQIHFDQVVMAGHADQSMKLLSDISELEHDVLSAFPYQENQTVLHTDVSVLPKRRRAWAAWNYLVPTAPQSTVAVSYDMNILQDIDAPETFIVSLNMDDRIEPSKILKRLTYHHPIYSVDAVDAQKRWDLISGVNRTHFCGAYWSYGFHEDGVKSGERVAKSLGVKLP